MSLIIEYLKTPPSREKLLELIKAMGIRVRDLLREKGTPYRELGLDNPNLTDEQLIDQMLAHPILINRPIVVTDKGVKLCRPSETVLPANRISAVRQGRRRGVDQRSKIKGRPEWVEAELRPFGQVIALPWHAAQAVGENQGTQARRPSPPELLQQWGTLPVVTDDPNGHELGATKSVCKGRGGFCHHGRVNWGGLSREPLQHRTREQKRAHQRRHRIARQRQNSHRAYAADSQRLAGL